MIIIAASVANLLLIKLPSLFLEICFAVTCFQNSIMGFVKTSVHKKFTIRTKFYCFPQIWEQINLIQINKVQMSLLTWSEVLHCLNNLFVIIAVPFFHILGPNDQTLLSHHVIVTILVTITFISFSRRFF